MCVSFSRSTKSKILTTRPVRKLPSVLRKITLGKDWLSLEPPCDGRGWGRQARTCRSRQAGAMREAVLPVLLGVGDSTSLTKTRGCPLFCFLTFAVSGCKPRGQPETQRPQGVRSVNPEELGARGSFPGRSACRELMHCCSLADLLAIFLPRIKKLNYTLSLVTDPVKFIKVYRPCVHTSGFSFCGHSRAGTVRLEAAARERRTQPSYR